MAVEESTCRLCGAHGTRAEVALGWSRETDRDGVVTALCAACARRHVREIECRLDP
ncbi:hypothetical protein [Modestobacter sp. Leaf380]|uniref:hypothetical protein n=1 Tax=Modestobacter sp. Leaf380 TaxID=1736356 RepID=UPI00190FD2AE|nr:hypothetical protein [Modestobacter sp. Leaf380]